MFLGFAESQNPGSPRKDRAAECEFQLFPHCALTDRVDLRHLQRYQVAAPSQQLTRVGAQDQDVASDHLAVHRLRFSSPLPDGYVEPLEGQDQARGEDANLLLLLRHGLLPLQHHHVGGWSRADCGFEEGQQWAGPLGMEL